MCERVRSAAIGSAQEQQLLIHLGFVEDAFEIGDLRRQQIGLGQKTASRPWSRTATCVICRSFIRAKQSRTLSAGATPATDRVIMPTTGVSFAVWFPSRQLRA